jgi:low temperature requirement protein LtrA
LYPGVSPRPGQPGRGRRIDLGHTDVAGAHLIERFRLFFIIALGETVLTTGHACCLAETADDAGAVRWLGTWG